MNRCQQVRNHPAGNAVVSLILPEIAQMSNDLKQTVYSEIQRAAAPLAANLNMPAMVALDETFLGDFPWFWQNGTNFNALTFNWLNRLLAYNEDGYVGTDGTALTTALFNVLNATSYVLDAQDAAALNQAILANATTVTTLITDWATSQGPIPSSYTNQAQQLTYISGQVLSWGPAGLTLQQLRTSLNPTALLSPPLGGDQVANDLITYLANTSSVANIQSAVLSFNNELRQVVANISPQPPLTAVKPGFMTTVDDKGVTSIVVAMDIAEKVAQIQNNLLPASGTGKSFSASFNVQKQSSNTVQVSAEGGAAGVGDLLFFLEFAGEGGSSYNMFSADSSLSECDITLTFNGVTTVSPTFTAYDITSGQGWWFPEPITEAVNGSSDQSGYRFAPRPTYDFGVNGTFGAIGRLMIAQQPVMTLTYTTANYQDFQETFQQESAWGITFLGIPIAEGSQSYYHATTDFNSQTNTVTVTMTPVGTTAPVASTDQLASVVGVQMIWPGASAAQNRAAL
ncbi:hypothetical protein [Pseudomonas sp. SBB6]|uniref:hypothetical protein n=1 Tax=Pseudomonas sp. SBB6 TaxID=2962032 RepID=UPI0020B87E76|nr:hypothetical protein [Pseudomonas sp. SBB6]MCP3750878.1 hypothetical protein [Pseudomonas sp. SBB6]